MNDNQIRLPLSRGLFALLDAADEPLISGIKWYAVPASDGSTFYATRSHPETGRQLRLHNVLMAPPTGMLVDHINRDGLDNRRENLRLATFKQNMANRRFPVGISGFRGVYAYGRKRDRWSANISRNGQSTPVGVFDDPADAARAFDAAARAEYGEFAVLNFPAENDDTPLRAGLRGKLLRAV